MITIPVNHKYATLALDVTRPAFNFAGPIELEPGLVIAQELPLALPAHWQKWLGSLHVDELVKANLFLFASAQSSAPSSLDGENAELVARVHRLYFGLLMAVPYIQHQEGTMMTGAHNDGQIDLRQVSRYDDVMPPAGCHGDVLDASVFVSALRISKGIAALQGAGEHSRTWRITHAFYDAVRSNEFGERLHQLMRSIEGFVLPDIGATRKQMINRCELFLGPGSGALIGELFDIRSAVEHLHGPLAGVPSPVPIASLIHLAELSYKSETIARHCLTRLFGTPSLWPHFKDDDNLRAFWAMKPADRAALWGPPMDTANEFARFSAKTAAIQLS